MKVIKYLSIVLATSFLMFACDNPLEEQAHSQLAPENVLNNREGIESVLVSAYGSITWPGKSHINNFEEWPTGISWQTGGGENRQAVPMIQWSWDPSLPLFSNIYNRHYNAIRDVNLILENVDKIEGIPQNDVDALVAEARALRAWAYYRLYIYFGATPLRRSTQEPAEMARATEEEMENFIETELTEAIPNLPAPGEEENYGRITSGGAMGLLTKFYLNTKQWEAAAQTAQDVIDLGAYELVPEYENLLKASNNRNSEFMLVNTAHPEGPGGDDGQNYMNGAFPPGFQSWPAQNLEMQTNWNNWASQYRLNEEFYNSFEEGDARRDMIVTQYVNKAGDTVDLLNNFEDNLRSFRIYPDPNAQGNLHGNDIPEVRYADILLARAEALNEIQGPNPESIGLINQVRSRANLDDITLAGFTKETLRDHIFNERKWEFYTEPHRRTDLIRKGEFVENARERGIENAADYRVLYPIPQPALDANPKLEQNPGY